MLEGWSDEDFEILKILTEVYRRRPLPWYWSGAMLVMWEGQIGRATRLWQ